MHLLGEGNRPRGTPSDDQTGSGGAFHFQQFGDQIDREAMSDNGRDDDCEAEADQDIPVAVTQFVEAQREQAGDRDQHDPARGDPRHEQPLVPGNGASEQADEDGCWSHEEQQRHQERGKAPVEVLQVFPVERCREHDKDARHQQDGDVFLERMDAPQAGDIHVRQCHAHHGDCDETGLVLDHIADHEDRDHHREQDRDLEIFRNRAAREQVGDQPGRAVSDQARKRGREDQRRDHFEQRRPRTFGDPAEILVSDHRAQCAGRVVDDRFPFQDRGGPCLHRRLAEQWQNHGGPGHHQNPAEKDCHRPDQTRDSVSRERSERPAYRNPDRRKPPDRASRVSQFAKVEAEAALEQDQRDADPDHGL